MDIEIEHSPITIGYYPFRAKAQLIRLLCQYLHVPYQDRFFTPDQWTKFKEMDAKKQVVIDMPFIIHEGFMMCGTWAPVKYIIELTNNQDLRGKTEKDRIRIDEIKNKVDLKHAVLCLITNTRALPSSCEQKKKYMRDFYEKRIEPALLQYEAECCENNFFFGYITVFDFCIYEMISLFKNIYSAGMAKLPKLVAVKDRVAAIPEIKAYEQSSRAVTQLCPIRYFNKFREQRINACRSTSSKVLSCDMNLQ